MSLSNVTITFTATVAEAVEQMTVLADRAEAMGASFAQVGERTTVSMETAGTAVGGFSGEVSAEADKVAMSNDKMLQSFTTLSAAADRTAEQFSVDYTKMAAQTNKLAADMEAASAKAAASTEAMGAKMDAVAAESGGMSAAFTSAATKVGLAGAAIGAVTVKMAADFQTSTTRLVTSAGETEKNLDTVRNGILSMAGAVGMSAEQLSQGMYTVESAGYHGADGLKVLQAAAEGAKEENAQLKTVADAVSTALTDYHLPASNAASVTSQLVAAVGQGKTTMEEFSGSLHSITPLAASLHLSLADVTGTLAEMTDHGMSADQAAQNLADTLRHLISPTQQQRAELAQLGLTATDLSDSLGSKGLSGTMDMLSEKVLQKMGPDGKMMLNAFNSSRDAAANLQEALQKLPPQAQKLAKGFMDGSVSMAQWRAGLKALPADQAALASGFQSIWNQANGFTNALKNGSPQAQNYTQAIKALTGDATGLNTVLMVTGENAAGTANNIKVISEATTEAGDHVKGWHDIQSNFNQKLAEAKDGLGALAIAIGEKLLPPLSAIIGVVAQVATWFANNKIAADLLTAAIGVMLVGGIVGLIGKLGSLSVSLVGNLINPIKSSIGFMRDFALATEGTAGGAVASFIARIGSGAVAAVRGLGSALLTGAEAMATLGRAALVTTAQVVAQAAAWVAQKVAVLASAAAEGIMTAAQWALDAAMDANPIGLIILAIAALIAIIILLVTHWSQIESWLRNTWNGFANWAKGLWNGISNFFVGLWNDVKNFFVSIWNDIVNWLKSVWTGAVNWAKSIWNGIVGFFTGLWNDVKNWFVSVWTSIGSWLYGKWEEVVSFARNLWNSFVGFFANLWSNIRNGVTNAWNSILNFFASIPGKIGNFFAGAGSWLYNAGKAILEGLLNGLKAIWNSITSFVSSIGSWISSHKGPIEVDRQLLVPHGNAIMSGLLDGLQTGGKKVSNYLDDFTTQLGAPSVLGNLTVSGASAVTLSGATATSTAGSGAPTVVINIAGSAVTERDLTDTIQKIMLQIGGRRPLTYTNYQR